jgi:hypothetical protein
MTPTVRLILSFVKHNLSIAIDNFILNLRIFNKKYIILRPYEVLPLHFVIRNNFSDFLQV